MKTLHLVVQTPHISLTDSDSSVPGIYQVRVDANASLDWQIWTALQCFHEKVLIEEIDNFHITVVDPQFGKELVQTDVEPDAYVAHEFDGKVSDVGERRRLRLVLEVDYELNGTPIEKLKSCLEQLVEHGSANGLLTGDFTAELMEHSYDVVDVLDE